MKKSKKIFLMLILIFLSVAMQNIFSKNSRTLTQKKTIIVQDSLSESLMDINNLTSWVSPSGFHDWKVDDFWNGAFPNGSNSGVIFTEGLLWGGILNDGTSKIICVNGNVYGSGCTPIMRLYRVRPDYLTADLLQDAADFFNEEIDSVTQDQIDSVRQQYQMDWNEWPAKMGAPYKDVNGNGEYDPGIDIPGIPGASQTLFILFNDSGYMFGSPQIGLQISETFWAYKTNGNLDNVIFKKVDFIYTGTSNSTAESHIDSMYIGQFSDPDIGDGTDDYAGCDTKLNLGYSYNSNDSDVVYQAMGLHPPAAGYAFLQGVSVYTGNSNDSAIINLNWERGYKYVNPEPMNSFTYLSIPGSWPSPNYAYQYYNLLKCLSPNGQSFPSSVADETSNGTYLLDGDPVTGNGKIDGILDTPGDRRIYLANGPFNLKLGDTAEVVIAFAAGLGTNNLNSISRLRDNIISADSAYLSLVKKLTGSITDVSLNDAESSVPDKFLLSQNYPNPFNPTTTIRFDIPKTEHVILTVYDILGNEVGILVDKEESAGIYSVQFSDVRTRGSEDKGQLSSGIYFYRLQAGNFVQTKKMLLLK